MKGNEERNGKGISFFFKETETGRQKKETLRNSNKERPKNCSVGAKKGGERREEGRARKGNTEKERKVVEERETGK